MFNYQFNFIQTANRCEIPEGNIQFSSGPTSKRTVIRLHSRKRIIWGRKGESNGANPTSCHSVRYRLSHSVYDESPTTKQTTVHEVKWLETELPEIITSSGYFYTFIVKETVTIVSLSSSLLINAGTLSPSFKRLFMKSI